MQTARARTLRIAGRFPGLCVRRTVRSDDVPCRREDSGNGIPGSSRFAPYIGVGALSVALARFRVGQTVSPEVGTKPAIPQGPRRKLQSARPDRAIPGKRRERVDYLFSTAIADAAKEKVLRQRRSASRVRRLEGFAFRRFGRML